MTVASEVKPIMFFKLFLIWFPLFLMPSGVFAQTCCSAGAPILSALEVSATPAGELQLGVQYDYNAIRDVYVGSSRIQGLRQRTTHVALLDISYGVNEHWAFTALFSFIRHERRLNKQNINGSLEKLNINGPGDVLLMAKYTLIPLEIIGQQQLAFGLGVKIPAGKSNLRDDQILLSADIQPGTGSWDYAGWVFYSRGFREVLPIVLFFNASFRLNGDNNRFQVDNRRFKSYHFGNVILLTGGLSYHASDLADISFRLQLRQTARDRFAGGSIPNTGGAWLYAAPGLNFNFSSFSIRGSIRFPIYRKLNEIQLTTTYVISTGLTYLF